MDETTTAKIRVTNADGTTAEDYTAICAFCGKPKHSCTCGNTARLTVLKPRIFPSPYEIL